MSFTGGFNFGSNPNSPLRFAANRGRISGSATQGVNYPSPFFDLAHTYLPTTVKQMFRFCRYYFMTNPLVNATVFKLSEYPITDIIIEHSNAKVRRRWEEYFFDHLRYRPFQIECGLDYNTFGNAFVSPSFPFHKYITCKSCGWSDQAQQVRDKWVFTNFQFRLTCPSCGHIGEAATKDHYYRNASGIKFVRWNCEDIEVNYNDITGESTYFYTVPGPLKNDIIIGKKDVVEAIPQIFIQALRQRKGVVFNKNSLFHLKRPTLAWQDRGWGTPLILPVLKDVFYLQIMKKAQEAILVEHIVPLRVLFPQAASGTSDPFTSVNLVDWKDQVAAEIARWRFDSNYIPILPLPLGQQSIGGDGRALLLFNEMQQMSEHIIMGMGVPREFLQGGLSYSGSNVSMRMLENQFISYMNFHRNMARWAMKTVANYMDWPECGIRFKPFKMADDLQRKAYTFQLNQAGKISDTTLLADADLDMEDENELMSSEAAQRLDATKRQQLAMAEVQGEQQLIMMKYQAKAQQAQQEAMQAAAAPGAPGGPEGQLSPQQAEQTAQSVPEQAQSPLGGGEGQQQQPGIDITQMAQAYAQQISQLPPDQQQMALQAIAAQSAQLAHLVQQLMGSIGQQPPQDHGVDQRPLPEQRPPTRQNALV